MLVQKLEVPASTLGEGPVWSDRDGCLYYVDISEFRLQAYTPTTQQHFSWSFDTYVGSLAECKSGGLILSLGDRVVHFDPLKGASSLETLVVLEADRPLNRLNDGKVDPWGRFWVGSMRVDEAASEGRLWCVLPDGSAKAVRDGIGVSNSAGFDRQRNRMYFADSLTGTIERADFDAQRELGPFQPFAKAGKGGPDGSAVDAAGRLWNAEWGGHRICCYSPEGSLERVLEMPTSRPSCCAFGGARHRTLFVTSARYNMTSEELAADPNAGALFSIELDDVEGLPADQFAS
jgi:sugar lactone lactonase YvrE